MTMRVKCDCGCDTFIVIETLVHEAQVDPETGILHAFKDLDAKTEEEVACADCDQRFSLSGDFKGLEY